MAVEMKGVCCSYGMPCAHSVPILKEIDFHVDVGNICSIVGPSGCGKTALLQCILGSNKVDNGSVLVFGKPPGSPRLGVPGPRVGYMPQDVTLYGELSIRETLRYFGRLLQMPIAEVQQRTIFFLELLNLPNEMRLVNSVSGGEQRRVSLACALLHKPELLILDEPTVGVDPLLRKRIWEHLKYLVEKAKCTIIITTHYIEEAYDSNVVAMMRQGRILTESSPQNLLKIYNATTLENVFLQICCMDNQNQVRRELTRPTNVKNDQSSTISTSLSLDEIYGIDVGHDQKFKIQDAVPNFSRLLALFIKNLIKIWRNPGVLICFLLLPMSVVLLGSVISSEKFHDLAVSYVNDDIGSLGHRFICHIDSNVITLLRHSSGRAAEESARRGDAWAAIFISSNFSQSILRKYKNEMSVNMTVFDEGSIAIRMDTTNLHITYALRKEIQHAFNSFSTEVMKTVGINPNVGKFPIEFSDSIYGNGHPTFMEFLTPGLFISMSFSLPCALTIFSLLMERKEGLLDRSWITGLTAIEVALGHIGAQLVVIAGQVTLILIYDTYISTVPCRGSLLIIVLMLFLQGLCGMAFGLMVASISADMFRAVTLVLSVLYLQLFIGGMTWPYEGMPTWLQYVSFMLPQTLPTDGLRSVMSRGWSLHYQSVWFSCILPIVWTIFLTAVSVITLNLRK